VLCALACHSINAGEPQLTRVGKGSRGRSHLARVWEMCPFRPNPLAPFPAREGGKFGGGEVSLRVGPKTLANPQPTRGQSSHGGGLWGVPCLRVSGPTLKSGGGGPGGRTPHGGGAVGGALFTPTKVSLFEKGRPSPTLIKAGVEGAEPPWRGVWGCPPTKPKEWARCPSLQPRHEWGPSHWRTLSLRGRAKGVQGGGPPMCGGCPVYAD